MQSNNTLDETNVTADSSDAPTLDSYSQKTATKSDLRSLTKSLIW